MSAQKPAPGDHVGFIVIRSAGEGPEEPDMTIFPSFPAALKGADDAIERRTAGGFEYGLYIAAVTLTTAIKEPGVK